GQPVRGAGRADGRSASRAGYLTLRAWRLWLAVLATLWLGLGSASAGGRVPEVERLLHLPRMVALLRDEGLTHGKGLKADMLSGQAGAYFDRRISDIYDADTMLDTLGSRIGAGLTADQIDATVAFFDSDRGQRIIRLELDARVAIVEPAVDDMAAEALAQAESDQAARVSAVDHFIDVNDLTERNVSGALGANYRFYRGLVEGGSHKMSEGEILDLVWSEEDAIRADTDGWLRRFLFMAYSPLSDQDMMAYQAFSESEAGQALNAALFDGFDRMYHAIYYNLGRAVADELKASDL
ncbi:MAG: hypothetical protein VXW58_01220, partial [Pseudomonadota bacterium]|nr:hypothetical protein [Pseudomonadota bacterium]